MLPGVVKGFTHTSLVFFFLLEDVSKGFLRKIHPHTVVFQCLTVADIEPVSLRCKAAWALQGCSAVDSLVVERLYMSGNQASRCL